jgi:Bacterial Ig domain/Secretion system C-terminal sorting domain
MKTTLPCPKGKKILLPLLMFVFFIGAKAQTETLSTGSFIINMGATNPNTIANGLKPYGLIYDLMKNYNVPVKWVISQTKAKDGVDFTYNGVQYSGGTFIVPAGFRSAAVNSRITFWIGQGAVGTTTVSPLTVDVTRTLTAVPKWTLDAAFGAVAQAYLTNAGITLTNFPGAYNWKSPATLDCCDDFFVLPHADPTWATHGRLWSWNKDCLGSIWSACHAVSKLENMVNPANPAEQTNFLSTNGLLLFSLHTIGTAPYTHQYPTDQVAQYLGPTDLAQLNGSESIYMPNAGGAWRPTTKIIAYDPTQANVPANSPGPAAVIVYGRGMGDPNRGYVMYEGSHSLNKGTANDAAAQRAFLNFSFFQVQPKAPQLTVSGLTNGQTVPGSATITGLNVAATSPLAGVSFTYQWSSTCGGSFSNATGATTNFTAPVVGPTTNCVITCKVSDNCGRVSFQSFSIVILGASPPTVTNDAQTINPGCGTASLTYNVLTNDVEPDGQPMTLTNVAGVTNGTLSFTASGSITYTSNPEFVGAETLTYTVCDNSTPTPACSNGTYTITVGNIANVPNAVNDAFTVAEDVIGTFNVLANDLPLVSGPLTVSAITSGPVSGRVSINTDNTITYVPNADFAGTDNFTYRIVNSLGYSKTATVTVTVTNDACDGGTYITAPGSSGSYSQTPLKDTYVEQNNAGFNFGIATTFVADNRATRLDRPLLQFSLTGIAANATITAANVKLVTTSTSNTTSYPLSLHRVTNAWDEGTANGAAGICNWTNRVAGPVAWTTPGGDFNPTAEATTNVTGVAAYNWTGGTMNTLVQNWVSGANANNGMLLKYDVETGGATNNKTFASLQNATVASRPLLTFSWTTPPTCGTIPVRAPLAMPDTATTVNGVAVNIATITNDYFPVAGAVTYNIVVAPVSGTATINAAGVVNYTPVGTFNGVRSLTYQVTHTASGLTDQAVVYINITNAQNDAVDDVATAANSGVTQTINVKTNDTDPEGLVATSTVTIATAPKNGTATVNGSGNILYTPNTGFTGSDTLYYSLCEPVPACGTAFCDIARVIVTVLNQAPIANNDSKTILPCAANTIKLLTNDTDPEGNTLTVTNLSALSNPAAGTLTNNNDGTVNFLPALGFLGSFTFTYTVTDNGITPQVSAPATVTITVTNPVNNPPVAVNDAETIGMEELLIANVLDNDSDPDNNPISNPAITIAPVHGTATVNAINGLITYIPNPGFFGTDVLTYQICDLPISNPATCTSGPDKCVTATLTITIVAPNIVVANNDENSTWVNTPVSGSTLINDFDPEGNNPLVFNGFIINGTAYTTGTYTLSGIDDNGMPVVNAGSITINTNGTYTFTPAVNFTGVVNVPYTIQDANPNAAFDTANLRITVSPLRLTSNSVIANNDENISYGAAVSSNVLVNDRDAQGNLFSVTGFNYDTNGDGTPDGTGTVGTPVIIGGVTTAGTPVSNAGTLTLNANGSYTFTPSTDFHGSVEVPYTICDNGTPVACNAALLHIDVLPDINGLANDPPNAGDDFNITYVGTPVNGIFNNNDSDPNGNPVSVNGATIVTGGAHTPIGAPVATAQGGTVQFFTDGTYTYTPPAGYVGPDNVIYTTCDVTVVAPQPLCTNAQIHFLVDPGISIAGKVWDDADGNVIDAGASEAETNAGGVLYVNLINAAGNVYATVPVNADGSYNFINVTPGANFSLVLSTVQGTVGQPAPAALLPAAWANTGTNLTGTTSIVTPGVIDLQAYGFTNTINYDFGIERLPNSFDVIQSVSQPIVGQLITLNGGANPPVPSGSDPEDGALGATNTIIITALPVNSTLIYNGVAVTAGQVILNFNPALLQLQITAATVGALNTSFQFAYIDAAGKQDPSPATYTINWLSPLPITLQSFTATIQGSVVLLKWIVSDEINVAHYEIECSANGLNFTSTGNSVLASNSHNYSMLHTSPVAGFNYYRLKIIDTDGKVTYSDIRKVDFGRQLLVSVYPNPVVNSVSISFINGMAGKPAVINVITIDGKILLQKNIKVLGQAETINLGRFAGGKYIIQIVTDAEVITKSITITR